MKKTGKIAILIIVCWLVVGAISAFCVNKFIIAPKKDYLYAMALYESGEYEQARKEFEKLGDYKDSEDYIEKCQTAMDVDEKLEKQYEYALKLMSEKKYKEAIEALIGMDDYKDSAEIISKCKKLKAAAENDEKYKKATALLKKAEFDAAKVLFSKLGDYKDSKQKYKDCDTLKAKWGKMNDLDFKIYFVDMHEIEYRELWCLTSNNVKNATGYEVQLVDDSGKKSSPKKFKNPNNSYFCYEAGANFPKSIVVRAFKESSEGSETLYGKWQSFDIDYESVSSTPPVISTEEESTLKAQSNNISGVYNSLYNISN